MFFDGCSVSKLVKEKNGDTRIFSTGNSQKGTVQIRRRFFCPASADRVLNQGKAQ